MSWLNHLTSIERTRIIYKADGPTEHAEIEEARHWNGSGKKAFGGHGSWPNIKLSMSFDPSATMADREAILSELEAILTRHGYAEKQRQNWKP